MKTYPDLTRGERIKKIISQRRQDVVLVLENIEDEKNISMILRSAEAFNIGKIFIIHLVGKKPKISKSISVGASRVVNISFFTSIGPCLTKLKKEGYFIIGTHVDPKARVIWKTDFTKKVALVMGNEGKGISEKVLKKADALVYIPMLGLTESLNVAVATSIFLYEVIRQKESE